MVQRGNTTLKKIDKLIGVPLINLLGLFRRRRPVPTSPRSIGVMVTAAIGDTILASALIRGFRQRYPESKITLIHGPSNALIAPYIPDIDHMLSIPVTKPWHAIKLLRACSFDVLIDTGQWSRINALLSFFSGARFTVGFETAGQSRATLYDIGVTHSNKLHEVENFRSLGESFALPTLPPTLSNLPESNNDQTDVLFHIKPSGEKSWLKEWPEENWIELINHYTQEGRIVTLTGSPEDAKSLLPLISKVAHPDRIRLLAGAPFNQTLQALQRARLVVSVNTGIMHIAAVLGKNLVALHGPTNPRRWGPLNVNSISLESNLSCAPCLNLGFEYGCGQNLCMRAIRVDEVKAASTQFLTTPK